MAKNARLIFLCGKMAAGKSTLARTLARQQEAVLLVQDEFLERLYPEEIVDIAGFIRCSTRVNDALTPLICDLLRRDITVVLDFPGNTKKQRIWFRMLIKSAGVPHELHFIDASNDLCKLQLRDRSKELPADAAWTTEEAFEAVTAYFEPPTPDEAFNVIRYERG